MFCSLTVEEADHWNISLFASAPTLYHFPLPATSATGVSTINWVPLHHTTGSSLRYDRYALRRLHSLSGPTLPRRSSRERSGL